MQQGQQALVKLPACVVTLLANFVVAFVVIRVCLVTCEPITPLLYVFKQPYSAMLLGRWFHLSTPNSVSSPMLSSIVNKPKSEAVCQNLAVCPMV